MPKEPTHYEILEAINNYATKNDQRLDNIESDIKVMKSDINGMKSEMVTKDYLEERLSNAVSNLVTKDYLDEKLMDLRGD